MSRLIRRLGAVDVTLIVIGGVIGSGIFRLPAVVAQRVHSPGTIVAVWILGGIISLLGAGVFAELAARRPAAGGWYAYLREAFHPIVAFELGWALITLVASGAMAAAAILFSDYFLRLTGVHVPSALPAAVAIAAITLINCIGVRQGCNVQNALTLLKLFGVVAIIAAGFAAHPVGHISTTQMHDRATTQAFTSIGSALIPVMFAYFGWQYVTLVCAEVLNPARSMSIGLLLGLAIVSLAYIVVNTACIRVLGVSGLAATATPAADVVRAAAGSVGAKVVSVAIVVSTLGFLSNRMLTAPRATLEMALNGDVFQGLGWIHPKTRVPVVAIALQGLFTMAFSVSGTYAQIVNRGTVATLTFVGLGAGALLILRKRDRAMGRPAPVFHMPFHPFTTVAFGVVCAVLLVESALAYPLDTIIAFAVLTAGIPLYILSYRARKAPEKLPNVAVET